MRQGQRRINLFQVARVCLLTGLSSAGGLASTAHAQSAAPASREAARHDSLPSNPAALLRRAGELEAAGDADGARIALERFFETHPEVGPAWRRLRQIYAHLAREAYARSVALPVDAVPALPPAGSSGQQPAASAAQGEVIGPAPRRAPVAPAAAAPQPDVPAETRSFAARGGTAARAVDPVPAPAPAPGGSGGQQPATPASRGEGMGPAPRSSPPQPAAATTNALPAAASDAAAGAAGARRAEQRPDAPGTGAPGAQAARARAEREIRELTLAWVTAWEAQDVQAYLGFYAADFVGAGARSRREWVEARERALLRAQDLRIRLSDLVAETDDDGTISVHFRQNYRSRTLRVSVNKTLRWARMNGGWVIVSEVLTGEQR